MSLQSHTEVVIGANLWCRTFFSLSWSNQLSETLPNSAADSEKKRAGDTPLFTTRAPYVTHGATHGHTCVRHTRAHVGRTADSPHDRLPARLGPNSSSWPGSCHNYKTPLFAWTLSLLRLKVTDCGRSTGARRVTTDHPDRSSYACGAPVG